MPTRSLRKFLATLSRKELARILADWPLFSNPAQRPPLSDWRTWLLLGGRGAGKTRAGAQWLKGVAGRDPHYVADHAGRIALVGETYADARTVMIEGESGLLALYPRSNRPAWSVSKRELVWTSGLVGQVFSGNDPERLRGSQFGAAWCDELAKWEHLEESWDMLQFCMRLGSMPRLMATTTPKPLRFFRKLMADPATVVTRSRTSENRGNLAPGFLRYLEAQYGGTRLGRQEMDGELVEDREDALWNRDIIEQARVAAAPELRRIVVAIDPPAGSGGGSAACGIVAVGMDENGRCYVLEDRTIHRATPLRWAAAAVALHERLEADAIVAEVNQGGDMVVEVLRNVSTTCTIRKVRATRGKWLRAEPVAALYERGLVCHAGRFPDLEDQMCNFALDGLPDGKSPDRLDALVWAITDLALGGRGEPRIRNVLAG
ncbi:MAG: terminase family protein [Rhizobiaceae bacterium]